jgi:hypothetical protein
MPANTYNPDVRHLDTAIAILGAGKQNRKPRTPSVHLIDLGGVYAVQVNGKMVAQFVDHAEATADAARRAAKVGVQVLEY